MFEELKGKEVTVQMGSASFVADRLKGTVMVVSDSWIKIQTKKKINILIWPWSEVSLPVYSQFISITDRSVFYF